MTTSGPRILTFDIETSPILGWTWGLFNQNLSLAQIVEPTRIICFAAKWLGDDRVIWCSESNQSHESMIRRLFELLDEADVVVTYNGDKFDIPHAQREFMELKLGSPSPFHSIDLYKVGKRKAKFASHKLAHITERLSLTGKLPNEGFELWLKVLAGDKQAWAEMGRYNRQDVVTTEELYLELLPWIENHPAHSLYVDDEGEKPASCPRCGGGLQRRGYAYTKQSKYHRYQCVQCGGWLRGVRRVDGVTVR